VHQCEEGTGPHPPAWETEMLEHREIAEAG